jgi:hypothetical protein
MQEDFDLERRKREDACYYCLGAGLISATRKVHGLEYSFSFRCPDSSCEAAKRKCNPYDVTWSDRFLSDYTPQWHKEWFK